MRAALQLRLACFVIFITGFVHGCGGYSNGQPQASSNTPGEHTNSGLDAALIARGSDDYASKCDNCHGADGNGAAENPGLRVSWDFDDLVTRIEEHNKDIPVACNGQCPEAVSAYIIESFPPDLEFVNQGAKAYEIQCMVCHGAQGEGGIGGALTPNVCLSCSNLEELIDRIDLTMPTTDTTICGRTADTDFCAEETAKYILAGFREISDEGTPTEPTPPEPEEPEPGKPSIDCPTPKAGEQQLYSNQGEASYMNQCALCHGTNGEGTVIAPSPLTPDACVACQSLEGLITNITETMPQQNPDLCNNDAQTAYCAEETAKYILSGFREVDESEVTDPPPASETPADQCPPTSGGSTQCEPWDHLFGPMVYGPIILDNCNRCHGSILTHLLDRPRFKVHGDYNQDLAVFKEVAQYTDNKDGLPLLLSKPSAQILHLGGKQFEVDSPEYKAMKIVLDRLANPNSCVAAKP